MRNESIQLGGATLTTYLLECIPGVAATQARSCVLVLPGGGYHHLSAREAEPVALRFCAEGMHACVLRYSVAPARWPQALVETAAAVALLRAHASEWGIDLERIAVMGFSAGGHLAGCLGAFWDESWLAVQASELLREGDSHRVVGTLREGEQMAKPVGEDASTSAAPCVGDARTLYPEDIRPNALVLGYPVVTSGEFAHRRSFDNLCGQDAESGASVAEHADLLRFLSLETRVGPNWPPTFLWHTFDDQSVPVENSLLLAMALHAAGAPAELHVFPHGPHGSALGVPETAMDKCGDLVTDPATGRTFSRNNAQVQPDTIATWPHLAARWLRYLP